LLTALGRARNTGTRYANAAERSETTDRHATNIALPPNERVAVVELGQPPIITEPITGQVRIAVHDPDRAVVFSLDDTGQRRQQVASQVVEGQLQVRLPGDFGVRFLEIVIQ
jgi:hypothetical protein